MDTPHIRRLTVERFRSFKSLIWHPSPGMNVILGGGNAGKTTLLEAIALLLYPNSSFPLVDADYYQRDVTAGFCIEAVVTIPTYTAVNSQYAMAWPWDWDGMDAVLPADDGSNLRDPVYKIRVRGTPDIEVLYEIVQPDDSVINLSAGLRRSIGLVKLSSDDRNERDLRLIQGSGLDRLLADKTLRGRLLQQFTNADIAAHLSTDANAAISNLERIFAEWALPADLSVGFVGNGNGASINSLIGLTADKDGIVLPLTSWGSGTRRLAALAISHELQNNAPITLIDELERGLEPYRQRVLVAELRDRGTQIFLTTHSAAVLKSTINAAHWYIDAAAQCGELAGKQFAAHQKKDAESFLARLLVVAEGITEVGFLHYIFDHHVAANWRDAGIYVTDGGGNENTLFLLEALAKGGLKFAGFVDDEGKYPDKWAAMRSKLQNYLFQWPAECLETFLIQLIDEKDLPKLIEDPGGQKTGDRLRTLAVRLGMEGKTLDALIAEARVQNLNFKMLVIEAATGKVPASLTNDGDKKTWAKHSGKWFKSFDGGQEIAAKMWSLGIWPQVEPLLTPFLTAMKQQCGLPAAVVSHE